MNIEHQNTTITLSTEEFSAIAYAMLNDVFSDESKKHWGQFGSTRCKSDKWFNFKCFLAKDLMGSMNRLSAFDNAEKDFFTIIDKLHQARSTT